MDTLELALLLAARAGRFDVVSQLANELEARRVKAEIREGRDWSG